MRSTSPDTRVSTKLPGTAEPVSALFVGWPNGARETAPFQDWDCLHISLEWVYEGLVRPEGWHLTLEDSYIRCWLIRKGKVNATAQGVRKEAVVGQWVVLSGGRQTQDFTEDAEILSVKFQLTWPGGEPLFPRQPPLVFDADVHPELEAAAVPLMKLVRKHFPRAHDYLPQQACPLDVYLRVQQCLPLWLLAYTRVMSRHHVVPTRLMCADSRSIEAIRILDHHPLGKRFSESALARKVGLSRAQLNRILMRDFSVSTRKYLERRKRESACEALLHTDISVKELGYILGFRHESHFCAWFKRILKATPSEYRHARNRAAPAELKRARTDAGTHASRVRSRKAAGRE